MILDYHTINDLKTSDQTGQLLKSYKYKNCRLTREPSDGWSAPAGALRESDAFRSTLASVPLCCNC